MDVDLADFEQAWAAAKGQPGSLPALRQVLATYTGTLLDPAQNPEAIAWVEKENLRSAQQVRVAWAAMTLAQELCRRGDPDQALAALDPLLASILNEDLWLCALRCCGDPS